MAVLLTLTLASCASSSRNEVPLIETLRVPAETRDCFKGNVNIPEGPLGRKSTARVLRNAIELVERKNGCGTALADRSDAIVEEFLGGAE